MCIIIQLLFYNKPLDFIPFESVSNLFRIRLNPFPIHIFYLNLPQKATHLCGKVTHNCGKAVHKCDKTAHKCGK